MSPTPSCRSRIDASSAISASIPGEWRGRPLIAPEGRATRPTSDRAREGLFSMLQSRVGSFEGLTVADLFAGTGALGLEALSRGAAHCLFVDTDRNAVASIQRNLASFGAAPPTGPELTTPGVAAFLQGELAKARRAIAIAGLKPE